MAKKKAKSTKPRSLMASAAPTGKSKEQIIQEVYDDELKDAVKTYIQNSVDMPAVGKDMKEADRIFLTSLKRIRDTQERVLQLIASDT